MLGMGVVFVFLVFLSAMMAALTANSGRREAERDAPESPAPEPAGAGSPGWIAAATAAYLASEQAAATLPSAGAWRPCETVEGTRWRLRMAAPATVPRQATS